MVNIQTIVFLALSIFMFTNECSSSSSCHGSKKKHDHNCKKKYKIKYKTYTFYPVYYYYNAYYNPYLYYPYTNVTVPTFPIVIGREGAEGKSQSVGEKSPSKNTARQSNQYSQLFNRLKAPPEQNYQFYQRPINNRGYEYENAKNQKNWLLKEIKRLTLLSQYLYHLQNKLNLGRHLNEQAEKVNANIDTVGKDIHEETVHDSTQNRVSTDYLGLDF